MQYVFVLFFVECEIHWRQLYTEA